MPTMSQLPFIAHGKTSIWSHSAAHLATRGGDLGWRRNILRAKEVKERRKEMEFNELASAYVSLYFVCGTKKHHHATDNNNKWLFSESAQLCDE